MRTATDRRCDARLHGAPSAVNEAVPCDLRNHPKACFPILYRVAKLYTMLGNTQIKLYSMSRPPVTCNEAALNGHLSLERPNDNLLFTAPQLVVCWSAGLVGVPGARWGDGAISGFGGGWNRFVRDLAIISLAQTHTGPDR